MITNQWSNLNTLKLVIDYSTVKYLVRFWTRIRFIIILRKQIGQHHSKNQTDID